MIACETLFKTFHVQSPAFLALQHSGFHRCTTLGLWATRQRMRSSLLSYRLKCCSFDQFLGELRLYSNRSACYVKLKKFDKDGQLETAGWGAMAGMEYMEWVQQWQQVFSMPKACLLVILLHLRCGTCTFVSNYCNLWAAHVLLYTDRTLCLTSTWHQLEIASSEITFKQ